MPVRELLVEPVVQAHTADGDSTLKGWLHVFPSTRAKNKEFIYECALEKDE